MTGNYRRLMTSQHIPGQPSVNFDAQRRLLAHVYENIPLETSNFQSEVNYYLNRKQSYSGNVVVVHKIKDEHITFNQGKAAMEISVVTDYIPLRLHLEQNLLNYQQALHLLNGACKGFRQLLHRVRSPFVIQSNMIGVDANGEVKVWWNPLFYRSNFGFNMSSNVKLRDMVRSLIQSILAKTNKDHANQLQKLFANQNETFVALEDKIKQISTNLNFKQIGKGLISNRQEFLIASKQCGLNQARNNSIMMDPLKLSSISKKNYIASTQRVILSPRKEQQRLQFNPKVITKRTYRGVSPTFQQKIKIIKNDIENLRAVVQPNKAQSNSISNSQVKLRSSRSIENIFSYRKGITGDTNIPQVSRVIKESVVIGQSEDLTISRFIEPISKSATQIKGNEHCNVCNNLQELRKSQIVGEKGNNDPMFLSRLQNLVGTDKSITSTSRSMNQSRLQKNQNNTQSKIRFGQSQKKLPQSVYFTSLFEM